MSDFDLPKPSIFTKKSSTNDTSSSSSGTKKTDDKKDFDSTKNPNKKFFDTSSDLDNSLQNQSTKNQDVSTSNTKANDENLNELKKDKQDQKNLQDLSFIEEDVVSAPFVLGKDKFEDPKTDKVNTQKKQNPNYKNINNATMDTSGFELDDLVSNIKPDDKPKQDNNKNSSSSTKLDDDDILTILKKQQINRQRNHEIKKVEEVVSKSKSDVKKNEKLVFYSDSAKQPDKIILNTSSHSKDIKDFKTINPDNFKLVDNQTLAKDLKIKHKQNQKNIKHSNHDSNEDNKDVLEFLAKQNKKKKKKKRKIIKNKDTGGFAFYFFTTLGVASIIIVVGVLLTTYLLPDRKNLTAVKPVEDNIDMIESPTLTPTVTPTLKPEVETLTDDEKQDLSILIVNATTKSGYAGSVKAKLLNKGYKNIDAKNAKGDYDKGYFILMDEEDKKVIKTLSDDTGYELTFLDKKDVEDPSDKYDLVIVLAK